MKPRAFQQRRVGEAGIARRHSGGHQRAAPRASTRSAEGSTQQPEACLVPWGNVSTAEPGGLAAGPLSLMCVS